MKKRYLQVENWVKKHVRGFALITFLLLIYIVLTKIPYINILLSNSDLFTLYVSVCVLFIFKFSIRATVSCGIGILILGFIMSLLGYASNIDILGTVLYVMILYMLILSLFKR